MKLQFIGLENVPMIVPGDDLVSVIEQSLESMGEQLRDDDVLVLAQKIISKSEDRYLDLRTVEPTAHVGREMLLHNEPAVARAVICPGRLQGRWDVGELVLHGHRTDALDD